MNRMWVFLLAAVGVLTSGCATLHTPGSTESTSVGTQSVGERFAPTLTSQAMYDVLAAEIAGQSGDAKTALKYYLKAMKTLPDPSLAARTMTVATLLHDNNTAIEAAQRWAQLAPNDTRPQQALGFLYARKGDIERAAFHLRRYVALSGESNGQALLMVGELLSQTVPADRGLPVMRRLIEAYSRQGSAFYAYGLLALQAGAPATALNAANQALKLEPGLSMALSLKAEALMMLGHQGEARRFLEGVLRRNPNSIALHLAYARLLVSTKHYRHARIEFNWLLKRDPHNPDVLYTLSLLDFELKKDREARKYLSQLAAAGYETSAAQYFLGRIAERRGDMEAALGHYANVEAGQYQFDSQVRIAYILARQGDLDQAREYLAELRASLADKQKKIQLYLVEGELLQQADDSDGALKLYDKALHEYPDAARLLYARALVASSLGDLERAESDLKKLIQANPKDAVALNALGYTLVKHTHRFEEALGYIQRALALQPGNPAILDSMGWVQFKLKHYQEATQYLERAYAHFPDPVVASHLIQALVASDQTGKARSILDQALANHPDDPVLTAVKHRLGL